MPRRRKNLTLKQIEEARRLRETPRLIGANGGKFRTLKRMCPRMIASVMGVSEYAVRRALDLEYGSMQPRLQFAMEPVIAIPDFVKAERDRMLSHTPSISEVIFGDPPPWRSAWGKKNEARQNP